MKIGIPHGLTGLVESVSSPEFATGVGLVRTGFETMSEHGPGLSVMPSALKGKLKGFIKKYKDIFNI